MPIFFIIRLVVAIAGTHEKTLLNTADQKKIEKEEAEKRNEKYNCTDTFCWSIHRSALLLFNSIFCVFSFLLAVGKALYFPHFTIRRKYNNENYTFYYDVYSNTSESMLVYGNAWMRWSEKDGKKW